MVRRRRNGIFDNQNKSGHKMLKKENLLKFLTTNRETLISDFNITKIGLIGSFARDEQTENSDIDLLLEFEPGTENLYEKKLKLKNLLKTSFYREIDLCREKYLKPYIKNYLLSEVIYAWKR